MSVTATKKKTVKETSTHILTGIYKFFDLTNTATDSTELMSLRGGFLPPEKLANNVR